MGYGNNNYNRGNYGNQRGGGYQNNRGGGNYGGGNRGGYSGGGNRGGNYRGGNRNNGAGGRDHKYVRSSFFSKTIVEDFKAVNGEKPPRVDVTLEPGITEEITIALTAQKANDLIDKILAAVNDPQGDGGIRMTLYCQHKVTQESGEEFDGASILVFGKFPSQNQGNRGGGQGNGRRDYPDRNQQGANQGTGQGGQSTSGQSQGNMTGDRGGNGQNAQNGASPSDEQYARDTQDRGYTENPGW